MFSECSYVTVVDGVSGDAIYAIVSRLRHRPRYVADEGLALRGAHCHGNTGVIPVLQLMLSFPGSRRSL